MTSQPRLCAAPLRGAALPYVNCSRAGVCKAPRALAGFNDGMGRGAEGCGAHRGRSRASYDGDGPPESSARFSNGDRGIANFSSLVEEPSDARLAEKQAAADEAEDKASGGALHPDAEEPDLMCVAVTLSRW